MKGLLFGIQRFSLEDGPGIRTTVFLKGCNMRCPWCHNPESWRREPEVMYAESKCASCGACGAACPRRLHQQDGARHTFRREACDACGRCIDACPTGALSRSGYACSADQALEIVLRDARYYAESGGGLTLSGGEPGMQPDFSAALLTGAREAGVNCAVETNAAADYSFYSNILNLNPLFLADYKLTDAEAHRQMTGVDRKKVVSNILRLAEDGADVVITCPIIPGVNDDEPHFRAVAELSSAHKNIRGFLLRPYHSLGRAKAAQLGRTQSAYPVPVRDAARSWADRILELGGKEYPVCSQE